MRTAHVVVGMNYGDEGKGRVTKSLSDENTVVVKHNGGSQAGHTVVHDGKRFVCSQIGAGAVVGAETYLASTFLINPRFLTQEVEDFNATFGFKPKISFSPNAKIILPPDLMANQLIETARGSERHGSCGHGIFEAFNRDRAGFGYAIGNMSIDNNFAGFYVRLVKWYERRLESLGLGIDTNSFSNDALSAWDVAANSLVDVLSVANPSSVVRHSEKIVFESGQGLGLDMDYTQGFPHLTPSKTGSFNPKMMIDAMGIEDVEVHYVTRPYATRHGNGNIPYVIPEEVFSEAFPRFSDVTNVTNQWQGSLRIGRLDFMGMSNRIGLDVHDHPRSWLHSIHMTCASQGDHALATAFNQSFVEIPIEKKALQEEMNDNTGISNVTVHHVE